MIGSYNGMVCISIGLLSVFVDEEALDGIDTNKPVHWLGLRISLGEVRRHHIQSAKAGGASCIALHVVRPRDIGRPGILVFAHAQQGFIQSSSRRYRQRL